MSWKIVFFIVLTALFCANCEDFDDTGYLSKCPGSEQPVIVADSVLSKHMFAVVQMDKPQLYTKSFFFNTAIKGIGTDPNIDFKNRKTMVYLDGYLQSSYFLGAHTAAWSYLTYGGYNVITIDALHIYRFIYPVASRISKQVGNLTANLLYGLRKYGLKAHDIELVGVSLGVQAMSFVGKHYFRLSGEKVSLINSLDPSGPCLRYEGPHDRLAPSDAEFVQVIHTDGDAYGFGAALGHVDFYVNGGESQRLIDPYSLQCEDLCSHVLSFFYFFTAFQYPYRFVGVRCESVQQAKKHACYDNHPVVTNNLGPKADPSKPGIYYVPVSAVAPFYAPKDFIKKKLNYQLLYNDAFSQIDHFVLSK